MGPLTGVTNDACRIKVMIMSHVPKISMSHVASQMFSCHMSNLRNTPCRVPYVPSRDTIRSMSHVYFKKRPCRHVQCKGQGPHM